MASAYRLGGPATALAAGVGVATVAPLTSTPGEARVAGVTLASSSIVAGVGSVRRHRRRTLVSSAATAMAGLIGPPEQTRVRATRWHGGFVGSPARVVIDYADAARAHDKDWTEQVERIARGRLNPRLQVAKHLPRKGRLVLQAPSMKDVPESMSGARARAKREVLKLLGPTAKVASIEVDEGQIVRIIATHEDATRFAPSGYRARVERTLSTVLPGRWRGRWDLTGDTVTFELRPSLPDSVWIPLPDAQDREQLMANYSRLQVTLGVDEDGRQVCWTPSLIPQLLITGGTGSGKTSSAHALVAGIAGGGWPVWISDAKRVEFLDFRGYPNVQVVATTLEDQVAMIYQAVELMQLRYRLIEHKQATVNDFAPLFVILDEFTEQRDELLEWYPSVKPKGGESRPPTLKHVARLARKARTARIHFIVLMQRPDAAFLQGETRDNFGMRISLGRLSPAGAMMMWENASVGVTIPRGLVGRCMTTDGQGRVVEAQAYRFPDMHADPDSEQGKLLAGLRPAESRYDRWLIRPAEEVIAESEVPGRDPDFWDYAKAPFVRAADRPDLDPLVAAANAPRIDPELLASTEILLGAGPAGALSSIPPPRARSAEVSRSGSEPAAEPAQDLDVDLDVEYEPAMPLPSAEAQAGDLVLVDEDLDHWAVLEMAPVESVDDPSGLSLFWRDHTGRDGVLDVSDDQDILIRHPILEQLGEPLPGESEWD